MCLGSSEWEGYVLDEDASLGILKAAYDRGLNTWDTADMYSNGISERVIGKAMVNFGITRHKLIIMTKSFVHVGEQTSFITPPFGQQLNQHKDYVNHGGKE